MAENKIMEIDAWIDNGYESEFTAMLMSQDVKNVEYQEVQKDDEGTRYAIIFRQFSPISITEGNWQIKDFCEAI